MVEKIISCKHVQGKNDITSHKLKLEDNANLQHFYNLRQSAENDKSPVYSTCIQSGRINQIKQADKADFRKYRIISHQIS